MKINKYIKIVLAMRIENSPCMDNIFILYVCLDYNNTSTDIQKTTECSAYSSSKQLTPTYHTLNQEDNSATRQINGKFCLNHTMPHVSIIHHQDI